MLGVAASRAGRVPGSPPQFATRVGGNEQKIGVRKGADFYVDKTGAEIVTNVNLSKGGVHSGSESCHLLCGAGKITGGSDMVQPTRKPFLKAEIEPPPREKRDR